MGISQTTARVMKMTTKMRNNYLLKVDVFIISTVVCTQAKRVIPSSSTTLCNIYIGQKLSVSSFESDAPHAKQPMSSLRNSLHRKNHKERSQLSHRQRFGILEKHKDYVLRARDYHSKQDRVKRLRQKAAERNKDEFYFGMNRERTVVCESTRAAR